MPELPEVETVRAGAEPHLVGRRLGHVDFARSDLRWPIPIEAIEALRRRTCTAIERRSKFLLLRFSGRGLPIALVHLGMTGRLAVDVVRRRAAAPAWGRHEHWRMHFGERLVRYTDARRFGALGATTAAELPQHPWLAHLGREPLEPGFDGAFLHRGSRARRGAVKALLMNAKVVVGIGNIYASEACWRAGVRPRRAAGSLTRRECAALAAAVQDVLRAAIAAGGTSFRDFRGVDAGAGYFFRQLDVYERAGEPCHRCGSTIRRTVDQGRSTYWCTGCQR